MVQWGLVGQRGAELKFHTASIFSFAHAPDRLTFIQIKCFWDVESLQKF